MNEESLKFLADQYGTTVERLWETIIWQAYINGLFASAMWLFFSCLFAAGGFWLYRKSKTSDMDDEDFFFPLIIYGLFFVIYVFATPFVAYDIFTSFFNPEFWAIKTLIGK